MPPLSTYSSQLDGSLKIFAPNNTTKHGSGSILVQNGADFYGSDDQYLKSSNVSADLFIQSAKNLNATGSQVNVTGSSGAIFKASTGDVQLRADAGNTSVHGSILSLSGTTKNESFTSTTCNSVADYHIKSSGANATLESGNLEARVFGHSLAHVKGNQAAKLESTAGNVDVIASTNVAVSGVNCSTTATTKATLNSPEVDVTASTLAKVEGPTVELGKTSDVVTISQTGKQTNIAGHCVVSGDLTVSGSTTTVDTQNVLVKDNIMVLNSASEVGKDAGLLFHRNGADSTTMVWDESESAFVFTSTESLHTDATIVHKELQTVKAKNFVGDAISMPGFETLSVNLIDNASTEHVFTGLKNRGVYEFQVESVADGGAVYQYKICKSSSSSASFTAFGIHQSGTTDEEVSIKWDASSAPALYHKTLKTGGSGANLSYKVKYLSVN